MKKLTLLFGFLLLSTFITVSFTATIPVKTKNSEIKKQQCIVKIVVTDENGLTISGVSVKVKGRTTGAATDSQGRCQITVPSSPCVLVFSYVGYITKEASLKCGETTHSIKLEPDVQRIR